MPNSRVGRTQVETKTDKVTRADGRSQEAGRSSRVTSLLMISTAVSRVLGYVKVVLIGALFGASGPADVWNAVFPIPNNLRKLLAEGALSSAFIPTLSASIVQDRSLRWLVSSPAGSSPCSWPSWSP